MHVIYSADVYKSHLITSQFVVDNVKENIHAHLSNAVVPHYYGHLRDWAKVT